MDSNLYADLATEFGAEPDRAFLVTPGSDPWTYGRMAERSAQMAGALAAIGVETGDRVVVQVDKSPENVALYLGCLRLGAVYVPLNIAYTRDELAYFIDDCSPSLVVTAPEAPEVTTRRVPVLTLGADGAGTLADAADAAIARTAIAFTSASDMAAMVYTSGTTGRSKGAMLTHRNLVSNARTLHQVWGFEPGDVLLHSLPIFHVHGLMVALHTAMLNASTVIFLPRFDVDQVIEHLPRATVMMGVPTHYSRLLADPRFDADLTAGIRLLTSGSAPMTAQLHAEIEHRTGHRILERYGMSEAGMITSNPYDGDRVAGTVGFALPGVEVRVRRADGTAADADEAGRVEVKGANVFAGYWRQPEKTAAEMSTDGFFSTGDIGSLDEHGRLTLEGRSGDMIISGGLNVYPREIELRLDECAGVHETAVVGLPHPDLGEAVTAFVVPAEGTPPDTDVLTDALDDLARFKHPKRYVEIDALPRNTMGKIQKTKLRDDHSDLYR